MGPCKHPAGSLSLLPILRRRGERCVRFGIVTLSGSYYNHVKPW